MPRRSSNSRPASVPPRTSRDVAKTVRKPMPRPTKVLVNRRVKVKAKKRPFWDDVHGWVWSDEGTDV